MTRMFTSTAVGTAIFMASGWAMAQFEASAQVDAEAEAGGQAGANSDADAQAGADADADAEAPPPPPPPRREVGVALPNQADEPAGPSDHEQMVGHLAIGYLGLRGLQIPAVAVDPANAGSFATEEVLAPIIGVRYWLTPLLGLDVGLGFSLASSSVTTQAGGGGAETTLDAPEPTVILVHGGVPLSLAATKHFSFQVVPELNVGYGKRTVTPGGGAPETNESNFHLDVGARAGAEIHFGFMDVPQLSLQGGIGLRLAMDNSKVSVDDNEISQSSMVVSTNVGDSPWNIFIGNVAALYYF